MGVALAVSLPTMLVGFARYSRDRSFQVLAANKPFLITMAPGSVAGTVDPSLVLIPLLAALLVLSSVRSGGTSGSSLLPVGDLGSGPVQRS